MSTFPEGNAVVYCQDAFATSNGKTAHGLVRRSARYRPTCVVDRRHVGADAGRLLDGRNRSIPVVASVRDGIAVAAKKGMAATHLVLGIAPDGGRLTPEARGDVLLAIRAGLHVDSGLHDFLSEDPEISEAATLAGVRIRDVRKPPPRSELHFFSGKIAEVTSFRVAVLGTDSAVGKRTTAWVLRDGLERKGISAEFVGTGQTSWMQGARYSLVIDSLVNDFVSGEIEHAVWTAWREKDPEVIVIEGQGSLLNPAYPGGLEILAAARPNVVVLQTAPARKDYEGLSGYPIHPLEKQIEAIQLLSGKPVVALSVNHEGLSEKEIPAICEYLMEIVGLPAADVLLAGATPIVEALLPFFRPRRAIFNS